MRYFLILSLFYLSSSANELISYFQESSKNQLLCQSAKHAYKMVSKENAKIVHIHGHQFIKIQGENLYLSIQGCSPANDEKKAIIF